VSFVQWLKKNEMHIDWELFSSPWDEMQLKHNPFRQEQIEAIINSSGILKHEAPVVLDLGCGPGILGKLITNEKPLTQYTGIDGDPLMLTAMQHLLGRRHIHALQIDLRSPDWSRSFNNHFDSVISLTALHWLSQEHQMETYKAVYRVLKPGGTFIVGDPYKLEESKERENLEAIHSERASMLTGKTWEEFWNNFFDKYLIKQAYTDYHKEMGYQIPFEGSDDGYPLSFQIKALQDIGFTNVSILWKADLRAVYGGTK